MDQIGFINEVKKAILDGKADTVEKLIGNDKEKLNILLPIGSLLHYAINNCQYQVAEKLVELGIDKTIIAPSHKGNALVNAARSGRVELVQLLLDHGFLLETKWGSSNPLQEAIANGRIDVFNLLINIELSLLQSEQKREELRKNCLEYAEIFNQNAILQELDRDLKKK